MASTSAPYGLQPINSVSGTPRIKRLVNGIASGLASNIYTNQPVTIDATTGQIKAITATTDKIYGVFMGCSYVPANQARINSNYWPSGATYSSTEPMWCEVALAVPEAQFLIQADGTVAQADFGAGFNVVNFSNNNGLGLSTCQANHTSIAGSSQGQLVLVEFFQGPDSAAGDAYTDLVVAIAYPQIIYAGQTSIG